MSGPLRMPKAGLDNLIAALQGDGYRVLGPMVRDGSVSFDEVRQTSDLPIGMRDAQEPGRYRVVPGTSGEIFGVVNGAGSLKPFFFAPEETLLEVRREGKGFKVKEVAPEVRRLAILGVRACDLAALAVQDRIFLHDRFCDTHYETRRKDVFLIAVNCTHSAPTCFCVSMKTGPQATSGFDLALTEMEETFVVESGSPTGEAMISKLDLNPAASDEVAAAQSRIDDCATHMRRHLDTSALPWLLYEEAENPRWKDVAARCLSCTNCTMVCPTCFCSSVNEVTDLQGDHVERQRQWDSCFNFDFSYMNGGVVRNQIRSRYRQWLTHKLASWIDQFGTSGCVGCGRCITWCPVGIDLTEEVAAIRGTTP